MKTKLTILFLAVLMLFGITSLAVQAASTNVHIVASIQEPTSIVFRSDASGAIVEVALDEEHGYDVMTYLDPGSWTILESGSRTVPEYAFEVGEQVIDIKIGFNSVRIEATSEDPSEDPTEADPIDENDETPNGIQKFVKGYGVVSIVITIVVFAAAIFVLIKYRR